MMRKGKAEEEAVMASDAPEPGTLRFLQLPFPPWWSQKPNAGSAEFKAHIKVQAAEESP